MKTLTTHHKSVDDRLKEIILPNGKSYYQIQRRKARLIAIVLALSTVVSLIFLVFSFVQKAAADTAREMAVQNAIRAVQNETLAVEQAQRHQEIARQLEAELAKCKEEGVH